MVHRGRVVATVMVAAAALGVAACSSGDGSSDGAAPDLDRFAAIVADGPMGSEIAGLDNSPAGVASRSDLVIEGQVTEIKPGRVEMVAWEPGYYTVVASVRVTTVLQGEVPDSADGIVYVEFETAIAAEVYDHYVPRDAQLVLYLWQMPYDDPLGQFEDVTAGRPAGQPLFRVKPHGFYIGYPGDRFVSGDGAVYGDTEINDFLPHNRDWPRADGQAPTPDEGVVPPGT